MAFQDFLTRVCLNPIPETVVSRVTEREGLCFKVHREVPAPSNENVRGRFRAVFIKGIENENENEVENA